MSSSDDPYPHCKLVILGESSVGKTSLIHRFSQNSFNELTANTIGAAFVTKDYELSTNADKKVVFEIWDTAGQERYKSLTPMYYRHAKVALVCYDLSNFCETIEKAKYWRDQLELNSNEENITVKIIGTKSDLVSNFDKDVYLKEFGEDAIIYKTSAKTGEGIFELFDDIIDEFDESFFLEPKKSQQSRVPTHDGKTIRMLESINPSGNSCC